MRTPIGSEPEKATMQLLHQTCRWRIDHLNEAGVAGGSPGKYGDQQRFSASTSSATSSVRQKRYELTQLTRSDLVEVVPAVGILRPDNRGGRARLTRRRCRRCRTLRRCAVGRDHLGHHLLAELDAVLDEREVDCGCGAF